PGAVSAEQTKRQSGCEVNDNSGRRGHRCGGLSAFVYAPHPETRRPPASPAAARTKPSPFLGQPLVAALPAWENLVKNVAMHALHAAAAPQPFEAPIEAEKCSQQILLRPERQVV